MPAVSCNVPVLSQQTLAADIRLLTVRWTDATHLPHAGQFFMLRSWAADEAPTLSRPISVHSWDADTKELQFLYQVKGIGTEKLAALVPGDTLSLTGPAGNGFVVADFVGKRLALVGGGIGNAPLFQLCRELAAAGTRPDYFAGFRDEPFALDKLGALCRLVRLATDSGRFGVHGLVTDLLEPARYDAVLVCGPGVMMRAVAAKCAAAGIPCFVSMESKMACGIGACLGCTCHTAEGPKTVCQNGPVFDAKIVFPEVYEAAAQSAAVESAPAVQAAAPVAPEAAAESTSPAQPAAITPAAIAQPETPAAQPEPTVLPADPFAGVSVPVAADPFADAPAAPAAPDMPTPFDEMEKGTGKKEEEHHG